MDHSAALLLMDPNQKFVGIISYQEQEISAIAKLKRLAALAPAS